MTPRLALSPVALSRPAQPPRRRSRSWLGLLCIAASLGAHGVLLAWVMPESPAPQPAEVEDQAPAPLGEVPITVLPKPAVEALPPAPAAAQPVTPPAAVAPPALTAAPPPPQPTAVEPVPAPAVPPAPPVAQPPEPPSPYANFPHLAGAQATCQGFSDCWRSPVSSSWRSAASDLQAQLEAQGYTLDNVTGEVLSIDSGVRVYAVSKPGEPGYYLNLVSVREGVLYTMTAEPITSEQVLTLQQS